MSCAWSHRWQHLFLFMRQCIVVVCVALWDRVAVGSSIERIELKEILLFFSYFWVRIPISYFWAAVIPIFLFSKCHLSLDTLLGCTWRYIHNAEHAYKTYQSVQCICNDGHRPILLMHIKTMTLWGYQITQLTPIRSSQSTCKPSKCKVWNWPRQAYAQIEYSNYMGLH